MLAVVLLILPLSLDTLAVSAALGAAGLERRARMRLGVLFAAFEAGMPVVGLLLGSLLGGSVLAAANYVAAGLLVVVGAVMLLEHDDGDRLVHGAGRAGGLLVALSVSVDELGIGGAMGLLRLPVVAGCALIAVQAVVVSQIGVRLGGRIASVVAERAEKLAGGLLVVTGMAVALIAAAGHG